MSKSLRLNARTSRLAVMNALLTAVTLFSVLVTFTSGAYLHSSNDILKRDYGVNQSAVLSKHAIVFTDVKLDDAAFIQVLMRPKKYKMLHIVLTALQDESAAYGHLDDFVTKQALHQSHGDFEATPYLVYSGGPDILEQDPRRTHEQHFLGTPHRVTLRAEHDLARNLPHGAIVDIFHIAPTAAAHIQRLADNANIAVRLFYHLPGYNSNQDVPSHRTGRPTPPTMNFLQTTAARFRAKHPKALVFFTASPFSFRGSSGSTQPLEAFKGRINDAHLEFALQDPFFYNKLTDAEEKVAPLRQSTLPDLPVLLPAEHNEGGDVLQTLITRARFMQPPDEGRYLREHFRDYIEAVTPVIEKLGCCPRLVYRLRTGVIEAFRKPPKIELADAVQGVCVLNELGLSGPDAHWPSLDDVEQLPGVRSIHWTVDDEEACKGMAIMRESHGDDEVHGYSLVGMTAEHARALLLPSFPVLPDYAGH